MGLSLSEQMKERVARWWERQRWPALALALLVAWLFRDRLEGWPLTFLLLGLVFAQPLARLIDRLADVVSLKYRDLELKFKDQEAREALSDGQEAMNAVLQARMGVGVGGQDEDESVGSRS